jgi:hypothetical protein
MVTFDAHFDRQVRETLGIPHVGRVHAEMISLAPTCHQDQEKKCACTAPGCKCVVQTTSLICHMVSTRGPC